MGKKSRNPAKQKRQQQPVPPIPSAMASEQPTYPSDGPSEEELRAYCTSSPSLQQKLDQLTSLALNNDRAGFVRQFVPLDLSEVDTNAYLHDLTAASEAETQWANLASEIAALSAGRNVKKIEGDQNNTATFFFEHPLLKGCDREVTFVCINGEWRAEG